MLGASEAALHAESGVRKLEMELRELGNNHQSLNSLSVQATLVVGFSLATLNADNLAALGDDQSPFCIYSGENAVWGTLFLALTSISIALNIVVVGICSYLIYKSQRAALDTNTEAAALKLREISKQIYVMFFGGLVAFFASATLIVWLFLGNDNWNTVDVDDSRVDNVTVFRTAGGVKKVRCLDPLNDDDIEMQHALGRFIASINTAVFLGAIVGGATFALRVARQFDEERLEAWYRAYHAEFETRKWQRKAAKAVRDAAAKTHSSGSHKCTDSLELVRHADSRV